MTPPDDPKDVDNKISEQLFDQAIKIGARKERLEKLAVEASKPRPLDQINKDEKEAEDCKIQINQIWDAMGRIQDGVVDAASETPVDVPVKGQDGEQESIGLIKYRKENLADEKVAIRRFALHLKAENPTMTSKEFVKHPECEILRKRLSLAVTDETIQGWIEDEPVNFPKAPRGRPPKYNK